ncbi:dihydrofolate reductase family protein [Mesorhizobium sp. B2-7-1]|uniref:dihydrofolate reductase family protein n=1 Tax=Mesorhizobium sp. B2-7-1 TaxID=2589909 RepID=UPI001FED4D46|nr:dihydrofolate reductase family protein [Mesorhizobium sp. B2-7-1]
MSLPTAAPCFSDALPTRSLPPLALGDRRLRRPLQRAAEICCIGQPQGGRLETGRAPRRPPARGRRRAEQQSGGNVYVHGSLSVARQLFGAGLVDRVRLLVYPGAAGQGNQLFPPDAPVALELVSAAPLGNGVVAMEYRPVAKARGQFQETVTFAGIAPGKPAAGVVRPDAPFRLASVAP